MAGKVAFGHRITSDWGSGYMGEITITNLTDQPITNWELMFEWDIKITSFYDCRIKSHIGNQYVVYYASWANIIKPNEETRWGFQGSPGNITTAPSNFVLVCDEFTTNVPLADITILEYDRTKIGRVPGTTKCTVSFKSDQNLIEWEARANGGGGPGIGLLVGNGKELMAEQVQQFEVETSELTFGDKEYIIKVYGMNQAGEWST